MMKDDITPSKLRAALDRADAVMDSAAAKTIRALRRFLKRYVRNFKAAMLDVALNRDELISLAEQQQMISVVTDLLEESGYGDVVDEFRDSLATVGKEGLDYFEVLATRNPALTGVAKEALELMAEAFVAELGFQMDARLIRPLEDQIRTNVLLQQERGEAVRNITNFIVENGVLTRAKTEFSQIQIETLVTESNRRFMELTRAAQAAALGLNVWVFNGPLDKVTSDQCRLMLGEPSREAGTDVRHGAKGFWYKEEITIDLHPKLKDDPKVARGHYNCRHQWSHVDEAAAKRLDPAFVPRTDDEARAAPASARLAELTAELADTGASFR